MKRKRHMPQEIIAKLRQAEVDLNHAACTALQRALSRDSLGSETKSRLSSGTKNQVRSISTNLDLARQIRLLTTRKAAL